MMLWITFKYLSIGCAILAGGLGIIFLGIYYFENAFVLLFEIIFYILLTILGIILIFGIYEQAKEALERNSK